MDGKYSQMVRLIFQTFVLGTSDKAAHKGYNVCME